MATSCSICGETLQSEGAAGLHALVAHQNPQPPPPPPPPPGAGGGPGPGPEGALAPPRARPGAGRVVVIVALGAVAAVLSGALVALVVGRGGGSSAPAEEVAASADGLAPASSQPGFHAVSKPDKGFAVDLPEGMTEVPLTADGLGQMADLAESLNPAVAGILKGDDRLLDQVQLFAIDEGSGSIELVQRIKAGRGVDIKDVPRGMFSDQYRELGAVSADEAMVRLPAGNALLISVQLPMGSSSVTVTQYVLAHDGHVWVLTNSGPNSAKNAADIAATFRFV